MSLAPGQGSEITSAIPAEKETPTRFLNREMSWLAFNQRVLEEALGEHNPLLERVNYLAITANNLDEFFMKRVGGLQRQVAAGVTRLTLDGRTPQEQLAQTRSVVLGMTRSQDELYEELLELLHEYDIHIHSWDELTPSQRQWVDQYFDKMILPILTPLGVGPGQPFPFISNLNLSLAVMVRAHGETQPRFARVKIPPNRARFVQIPNEYVFIPLEELIARYIDRLFIGMEILETAPFRVTRNADLERNEEEADDLLEMIEEELRNRKFAPIVRLETSAGISEELLGWLTRELEIESSQDVYQSRAPLGLHDLVEVARLEIPNTRFKPHAPLTHPALKALEADPPETDFFEIIRRGDLLVHHPYQSFKTSVLALLQTAAADPRVLAIKQTLYRTAKDSPIVTALLKAIENGKEVTVHIEIKARFDEANNIEWVRKLEKAGAHVTYGFVGIKTHCKTLLIVREEADGIRRYCHIGTGNYHTGTSRLYTDLGLFTCDPALCQDVADLFNYLTGHSSFKDYKKLLVAPVNMRGGFITLIQREAEHARAGCKAQILAKMNQLEDPAIIEALYAASQAGVRIDLIVRGFCCLRPGVPGLSENIRVMSIIGRFLEHSRVYYFLNDGRPEYYIGSGDWMSRNLDWRVEATAPIESPDLQKELDIVLRTCWADRSQSWDLQPDGVYRRRRPRRGRGCQQLLIDRIAKLASKKQKGSPKTHHL